MEDLGALGCSSYLCPGRDGSSYLSHRGVCTCQWWTITSQSMGRDPHFPRALLLVLGGVGDRSAASSTSRLVF